MYIAQPAALRHGSSAGSGTLPTGQSARHQPNPTHAHPPSTPTSPLQQPTPPAPPKPSTPSPLQQHRRLDTRDAPSHVHSHHHSPQPYGPPHPNNHTKHLTRVLHRPNAIHNPTPKKSVRHIGTAVEYWVRARQAHPQSGRARHGHMPCRSRPKPTPPQPDNPQKRSGRRQC